MRLARSLVVVALGVALLPLAPAASADEPGVRSPSDPDYVVSLRSGGAGHRWEGTEAVSFTNARSDPLTTVWFRLWSNGVLGCRDELSIRVSGVQGGTAGPLDVGCTALPVDLDQPVQPGERGQVSMTVVIDLPHRNDRFGWLGHQALLGTALPTLAIEDDAGWHLDPFVDLGESFYSVVGHYEVTLDVPKGLATPSTGALESSETAGGRDTRTYMADHVRDFEWAAGTFAERTRTDHQGVLVRASLVPGVTPMQLVKRSLRDAVKSMNVYAGDFGDFPYAEMDVVITSFQTFGGMEYPTIIFTNPDAVTHEIGHQWWYGIVGDDQYLEPWLDEAFATWVSVFPYGWTLSCEGVAWPGPEARVTNGMAYWVVHPDEYGWVVYGNGACALAALAKRFGLSRFIEILREYAAAHWLGFSTTLDFMAAVEAAAAEDLPDFDIAAFWERWRIGPA